MQVVDGAFALKGVSSDGAIDESAKGEVFGTETDVPCGELDVGPIIGVFFRREGGEIW